MLNTERLKFNRNGLKLPADGTRFIAGLVALLVSLPIILDLSFNGVNRAFFYSAADAFYYFTIGDSFADSGIFSFDQSEWTSGYHPLWGYIVGLLAVVARFLDFQTVTTIVVATLVSSILLGAGIWLTIHGLGRAGIRITALWVLVPVGITAIAALPLSSR